MAFDELKGSDIVKMVQDRLGGYANALNNEVILDVVNEGKDEVWAILKNLSENYFQASTQSSDNSLTNYFGPLSPTQREYALPADFRAVRYIECITPGYTDISFVKKSMTSPEWRGARKAANEASVSSTTNVFTYLYDIAETVAGSPRTDGGSAPSAGGFQIVMAQFPNIVLQLVIWYLRAIPEIEADTALDTIIIPYSKKIANFAVEKAMKILQDLDMSEAWMRSWRQDIITIAQSGGQVNQADPVYVQDFEG